MSRIFCVNLIEQRSLLQSAAIASVNTKYQAPKVALNLSEIRPTRTSGNLQGLRPLYR